WTAGVAGGTMHPVQYQLDIEETEINFLGNKTWIPGKQLWQETTFVMTDEVFKTLVPSIISQELPTVTMRQVDKDGKQQLESWYLHEVHDFKLGRNKDDKYELTFRYNKVVYKVEPKQE